MFLGVKAGDKKHTPPRWRPSHQEAGTDSVACNPPPPQPAFPSCGDPSLPFVGANSGGPCRLCCIVNVVNEVAPDATMYCRAPLIWAALALFAGGALAGPTGRAQAQCVPAKFQTAGNRNVSTFSSISDVASCTTSPCTDLAYESVRLDYGTRLGCIEANQSDLLFGFVFNLVQVPSTASRTTADNTTVVPMRLASGQLFIRNQSVWTETIKDCHAYYNGYSDQWQIQSLQTTPHLPPPGSIWLCWLLNSEAVEVTFDTTVDSRSGSLATAGWTRSQLSASAVGATTQTSFLTATPPLDGRGDVCKPLQWSKCGFRAKTIFDDCNRDFARYLPLNTVCVSLKLRGYVFADDLEECAPCICKYADENERWYNGCIDN